MKQENCTFCEGTGQIVSSTTISGFKTCDCINIPQEEPKQDSVFYQLEVGKEYKQEVFELGEEILDAAHEWVFETNGHNWSNNDDTVGDNYGSFIAGAEWQAKTMYSKEAVEEMFSTLKRNSVDNIATIHNIDLFIKSWTREFKK